MSNNEIMSFQEDIHSMEIPITKEFPVSNPPIRVAIYCRTANNSDGNLIRQEQNLIDFVLSKDVYQICDIYSETSETGAGSDVPNLPEMKKLLRHCKKGEYDVVVIQSLDRLGRNYIKFINLICAFEQMNVKIKTLR